MWMRSIEWATKPKSTISCSSTITRKRCRVSPVQHPVYPSFWWSVHTRKVPTLPPERRCAAEPPNTLEPTTCRGQGGAAAPVRELGPERSRLPRSPGVEWRTASGGCGPNVAHDRCVQDKSRCGGTSSPPTCLGIASCSSNPRAVISSRHHQRRLRTRWRALGTCLPRGGSMCARRRYRANGICDMRDFVSRDAILSA